MDHYKFFQNRECEYFPCHKNVDKKEFNCLFCFCPLYALGDQCEGNFTYTQGGVKDCSGCAVPHRQKNYDVILEKLEGVVALAKKKAD